MKLVLPTVLILLCGCEPVEEESVDLDQRSDTSDTSAGWDDEDAGALPLLSGATGGVTVLETADEDVSAPAGLLTTLLPSLSIAPALLVEVTSYSATTGSLGLLTAWGEVSTARSTSSYSQGPGATSSCSGTSAKGKYSASCGSMWTDMEGTTMYLGSSGTSIVGATLYSSKLSGSLASSGATVYLADATLTGKLDLSSLTDETGMTTMALCLLAGGCSTCPASFGGSCVDFTLTGLSGSLDTSLDLVTR